MTAAASSARPETAGTTPAPRPAVTPPPPPAVSPGARPGLARQKLKSPAFSNETFANGANPQNWVPRLGDPGVHCVPPCPRPVTQHTLYHRALVPALGAA